LIANGAKVACSDRYFFWRDPDGSVHAWEVATQKRIDYAFKADANRPFFYASDATVVVEVLPNRATLRAYDTATGNALGDVPYAVNFAARDKDVLRMDQFIDGQFLNGTRVRLQPPGGAPRDVTSLLPTTQPPTSFDGQTLVIPGAYPVPFPLYIVHTARNAVDSVVFDGGIAYNDARATTGATPGLVVWYVRNGTDGNAIRVYRGFKNDAASRFELGDEVNNRPKVFADGPRLEHKFIARIETFGDKVLYGSTYGIWAYDLQSGKLQPAQLAAGETEPLVAEFMCVTRASNTLMYRRQGDTVGQVWAVPLTRALAAL
jgi:hypothetical protein